MKRFIIPILTACLCACSGNMELETKATRALDQVFIARSWAGTNDDSFFMQIRAKEAYIKFDPTQNGSCLNTESSMDLTLHYDFEGENKDGGTFDLKIPGVEFSTTDGKMSFTASGLEGSMKLSDINDELPYSEVAVSGSIFLQKNALASDLLITGMVKGREFSLRIDSLSLEIPKYQSRTAIVEYAGYYRLDLTNNTSNKIDVTIYSPDKLTIDDLSFTIKPQKTSSHLFSDFEFDLYRTYGIMTVKTDDGVTTNINKWYSTDSGLEIKQDRDFFIHYDENKGRIEPQYYPVISINIEKTLSNHE